MLWGEGDPPGMKSGLSLQEPGLQGWRSLSAGNRGLSKDKHAEWECPAASTTLPGDFPGGPVAKTLHSQCRGPGSSPGQGTRSRRP